MDHPIQKPEGRRGHSINIRLLTGLCVCCLMDRQIPAEDDTPAPVLPRVRVSTDGKHFELGDSGRPFLPWGFNYLGRHGKLAEDDWDTPAGWERLKTDFRAMRKLGANVVRWHLQFETFMTAADQTDAAQLARLKQLLQLARDEELYLDLTGLNCFRKDRIPAWYDALSEADRWTVQARFWSAIAQTCAKDSVVFCYDLMNEPVIGKPAKDDHPWVGGELGGLHFVQRICNAPGDRNNSDIAAAWVRAQVEAIREYDRETMTTVGVIPLAFIWPKAQPVFYSPSAARHLDFVSIHVYPTTGKLEQNLAALDVYRIGKPLVIEEIFPLSCSLAELDRFVDDAAPKVDGWISHYFGATPAEHRAGALPGAAVAEFLEYWSQKRDPIQRKKFPPPEQP